MFECNEHAISGLATILYCRRIQWLCGARPSLLYSSVSVLAGLPLGLTRSLVVCASVAVHAFLPWPGAVTAYNGSCPHTMSSLATTAALVAMTPQVPIPVVVFHWCPVHSYSCRCRALTQAINSSTMQERSIVQALLGMPKRYGHFLITHQHISFRQQKNFFYHFGDSFGVLLYMLVKLSYSLVFIFYFLLL